MIIETKRLILRPFTNDDVLDVLEFGSNPLVTKPTGDSLIFSEKEALDIITNIWLKEYNTIGYGRYAVVYKADSKVIGFSGLKLDEEIGATDIGYRFLPKYWGKGIATESSLPFIKMGFEQFNLNEIVGLAFKTNIASIRVLKKLGMQLKKEGDFLNSGNICDWYEIIKTEFNENLNYK